MNEDTPPQTSSNSRGVIVVVAILLFYILAPGPVVLFMQKGLFKEHSVVERVFYVGWWPLQKLAEEYRPVTWFYESYLRLMGVRFE